jgi:hypothetical protein
MNSDQARKILCSRVDHVIGAPRACLHPPLSARLAQDYRPWCAQLRDAQGIRVRS